MTDTLKVACAQLTSTTDIAKNIEISSELVREAHGQGAQLIGLTEVVNLVQRSRRKSAEVVKTEDEETSLKAYRELAAELGVWLHTGSLVIKMIASPFVILVYLLISGLIGGDHCKPLTLLILK